MIQFELCDSQPRDFYQALLVTINTAEGAILLAWWAHLGHRRNGFQGRSDKVPVLENHCLVSLSLAPLDLLKDSALIA